MNKLVARQRLVMTFTFFSMFFGAGNLIFPPFVGAQAGSATIPAAIGFIVSAVGLPILGVLAVTFAGGFDKLASRVSPKFALFLGVAIMLTIGPCFAIPRTATTSFEMMVAPFVPSSYGWLAQLIYSLVFFTLAFLFAQHPEKLSKVLGRFMGPLLLVLIAVLFIACLIHGIGTPANPMGDYSTNQIARGFLDGYQTMDLLASLAFGIIIAETIHELGVTDDRRVAFEISRSGVIAGVLMAIIYCGLGLVGMQLGTVMPDATNGAAILARSASMHFGLAGTVVVFAIFFLACMNVCVGLISCCSRYFCETYVVEGGAEASEGAMRRPFAILAFVFAAFSCVLSNVGLDVILMFSVPMLNALYPVAIVLVLMGLVHGFCDAHPQVWVWVGGVVAVQSVITSVRDAFFGGTWLPFDALPLADIGAAWAPVAVVAFVIGLLHSRFVAHSRS